MVLIFYSCEKQRQAIIQVQKFNDTQVDMQPQLDLPIILEICCIFHALENNVLGFLFNLI